LVWSSWLNITQFLQVNGAKYDLVWSKEFVRGAWSTLGFDELYGSKHIKFGEFCFAFSVWMRAAGESAQGPVLHALAEHFGSRGSWGDA
jgi:hypothetical protein